MFSGKFLAASLIDDGCRLCRAELFELPQGLNSHDPIIIG